MSLGLDREAGTRLIHQAIDLGINYFDTADLYDQGANEALLGQAVKEKRDKVILATKVGNQWRADGSGWDWNPRKAYILKAVEGSLQRLQTEFIDLYQLHGGTIADPFDEIIEAFELLQQQGKIRYYGISSIRPNVIREYVKRSHICSVMMQYSLLDRRPEESCLPLLQDHQVGVLARGTLAGGLLVNKPATAYLGHSAAAVATARTAINALAQPNRPAASTAIQFALSHPAINTAIIGIHTPRQLTEALAALTAPPLSANELLNLRNSVPALCYAEHL
jgi:aryl-alcohol dehydrogenase-like predicted oxidoreductase